MTRQIRALISTGGLLFALFAGVPSLAQKSGGVLHVHALDSPPSLSMHEEVDAVPARAMMGVFNHLVVFDQHIKQNSMQSIVPDLATGWSWSEDGTQLTFPLREGIKWHDGRPFTAKDVKCTWDLLTGKSREKLRLKPRKSWYGNLEEVTADGDHEVTFHFRRPQPAFLALLASAFSVVYPCHVPPAEMRRHPIGTGPFKFVEFKHWRVEDGEAAADWCCGGAADQTGGGLRSWMRSIIKSRRRRILLSFAPRSWRGLTWSSIGS